MTDFSELLNSIREACSRSCTLAEHIGVNRGVRVSKIRDNNDEYSLKYIFKQEMRAQPDCDPEFRITSLEHEAAVLKDLLSHGNDSYIGHASTNETVWLLSRWRDGKSAGQIVRESSDGRVEGKNFHALATSMIGALQSLHSVDYLHGDIQPRHFILQPNLQCELIDFGLARKSSDIDTPYKGALVHFNSPEVSEGMLKGKSHIQYSRSSEIYSLGATLFFLHTGKLPIDYGSEDLQATSFNDKLRRITAGKPRSVSDTGVETTAKAEEFFQRFLAPLPRNRYRNLTEVLEGLNNAFS